MTKNSKNKSAFCKIMAQGFCGFRSSTKKKMKDSIDNQTIVFELKINDNNCERAFNQFEKIDDQKNYSVQKAYQIMAFNMVLLAMIFALINENYSLFCFHSRVLVTISMVMILLFTLKSVWHCIMAIYPQTFIFFRPIDHCRYEKKEFVEKIQEYYEQNETSRAIIADHVRLAVSTTIFQITFSSIPLFVVVLVILNLKCPFCG